jgi:predicted HicB family RNase H-like nuclease
MQPVASLLPSLTTSMPDSYAFHAEGSPRFESPTKSGSGSPLPKWVEQDRKVRHCRCPPHAPAATSFVGAHQVLRFYGYFKEAVVESYMENHRVRKVIIYYYLEDDSIHVAEPKQDNSGICQVRCRPPASSAQRATVQVQGFNSHARVMPPASNPAAR